MCKDSYDTIRLPLVWLSNPLKGISSALHIRFTHFQALLKMDRLSIVNIRFNQGKLLSMTHNYLLKVGERVYVAHH